MTIPLLDRKAYVTLLTNEKYLAGLLLLDDTMKRVKTRYPLVVLTTPSFPDEHLALLATLGIQTRRTQLLEPKGDIKYIAERFRDTWSKLQAFALTDFERVVLLDCDMTIFRNIDNLLDDEKILPSNEWIAANHSCICNPLKQDFYEPDCCRENCGYTYAETHGAPPPSSTFNTKRTYTLLNSGLVVLSPSQAIYDRIIDFLYNSPKVATMALPDQDLLGEVFLGKWEPLSWRYNAIKTLRWDILHPKLWFDEQGREGRDRPEEERLAVLHYIVEKPWLELLPSDHRDAETHRWWWADWRQMMARWAEDEELSGYVKRVEGLVVKGTQE
ncbi:hypothetical protein JCM11251_007871 [Rhodosporidiobolus azoricus]